MSEKQRKENRSVKMGKWGKPLLILSALTSLSVPSVHVALADNGESVSQTSSTGSPTGKTSSNVDGSDNPSQQPTNVGQTSTTGPSVQNNTSSDTGTLGDTLPSIATSSSSSITSTSSASTPKLGNTANVQNNEQPIEPNKVTNNVGSSTKTVSQSVVQKASVKTVQSPQTNYTAVQNMVDSSSTNDVTGQFISEIGSEAQEIASENDLYASVMIAQAILESASGQSGLTQEADNLFGIKGTYNGQYVTMNTYEDEGGNTVEVEAQFRKYPSLSASMQDYANLLKNGLSSNPDYYAKVWKSNAPTYQDAAQALQGTYATDTTYASSLDQLISEYDLTKYDSGKAVQDPAGSTQSDKVPSATVAVGSTVATNGILYASSDASSSVKTNLSTVKVSKIYPLAINKYQVTNNGTVVGYLRTLSTASSEKTPTTAGSPTAASQPSSGSVGSTVKTNGILYASSDADSSVRTSLTTVTISKIYPSATNKYQVMNNGTVVGYLRTLSTASSEKTPTTAGSPTAASQPSSGSVGSTVKTNGILYASSDASGSVKTSLTTVTISKIYPSATNKYQVMNNGTVVGYLRTLSTASSGNSTSGSTVNSSAISVGSTVNTNGVIYLSSDAAAPLITSLTKAQVSKIYPSAKNKYQVEVNGVVVGYLRFASAVSASKNSSPDPASESVGSTINTNGILYVSSTDATYVKTSLTTVTISKIYPSATNKYQVEVNGTIVGYLR
ncbi:glucosaminidase domain-containing protein [Sporolactobacillus pectinivorans]|uniref:glucosaminidase domain-containing protein n=1 Tax=Sporolactobacillus pectinivorans TaxID=1591408 RepID=UPI000C26B14F|nr:glucosaminidase domain-containing protein [Sporolactobacillus pectinivorans]